MKLLIAGLPGTGKTTFGSYLATIGFTHIDLEEPGNRHYPPFGDVVCTWGFIPDNVTHTRLLDDLNFAGYKFIWFDDGGVSSYKKYIAREGNTYNKNWLYFRQIFKIEKYKYHSDFLQFIKINPMHSRRLFKGNEQLLQEIKDKISQSGNSVQAGYKGTYIQTRIV